MNLSEPYIRRPIMTTLIMIAVMVIGVVSFYHLPVSNLPDVDYPVINVTVSFPGASPETMANTIAMPLEKEFMTIPGMKSVTSSNGLGHTSIILQFDIAKSMDSAAQDVEAAISRAKSHLPPDLPNDPIYKKINPSDTPIIYIALTSATVSLADLYTYANTFIGQRLSMLDGVAQVLIYGSPYAIRVQVNPDTLANLGITLGDVAQTIIAANPSLPTGEINGINQFSTIVTKGQLDKAVLFDPLIVSYHDQAPVRIRDLGQAIDSLQNDKYSIHYLDQNVDEPTIVLAVMRQPGANTVQVADAVNEFLPKLESQLPASVKLRTVFDRSLSIKDSVEEVELTLIIALGLVILIIFICLGKITDTLIPSLVLPMSVIGTFAVMYVLDFSIDNLSLLALILATGFIIDDAIVVLENIVRYVEKGLSPWEAALKGSKEISFTILSMTLSLIAVFIPMLFMGGLIGKILQEFAITLVAITIVSGLISLTLTPMLCSLFIKARKNKPGFLENLALVVNNRLLALYKPILNWMLDHRWFSLVLGAISIIASAYYFHTLPKDFIPEEDIGFMIAYTQSAQGTSSKRMKEYQQQVIDIIRKDPAIESLVSIAAYPQYRNGVVFIRLKPRHSRTPIVGVMQRLYKQFLFIPGINTYLKNVPLIDLTAGSPSQGSYQYTLQSMDMSSLADATEKLVDKLQSLSIFQGVTSDLEFKTPQLNVSILRDQASSLGIAAVDIEAALQFAYAGGRVSRIQTSIDQYDIILEVEPQFQQKTSTLSEIYVRSRTTGQLVPLTAVAHWKDSVGPASINHVSQFPSTTISFNLAPHTPLETALNQLKNEAKKILPLNVIGEVKGAAQTFEESLSSTYFLLLVAIFAIYIVLGILYESFIHPLTILSTLPPATFGALLTLYFLELPLSLYAFLGIILLIGIVKKNGIMMVDYALENERTLHQSPREAIYQACLVRFRPIMMTTITAIMGAIPIALAVGTGADSRRPLGWVMIGGLLFSQLITLLVTPVIYLYMDKWNKALRRKDNLPIKQEINESLQPEMT